MKGIMVPLLILLTTGIVVGQQNNSSNNTFNANPNSRQEFSPNNDAADQGLVKPLEIGVKAKDIVAIRGGEAIVALVEAKDVNGRLLNPNVISGISLFRVGNDVNLLPKVRMQGEDLGNGILQFALTEDDLFALNSKQLYYDFTFAERGKYKEVEVFYARNDNPAGPGNGNPGNFSPNTPVPDDGQNGQPIAFGSRNGQNPTPYIPLPAPAEPGEVDFMGPARPPGQWTLPEQNNGFNSNQDTAALLAQYRAEQAEKQRQREAQYRADQAEQQRQRDAAELAEARRQQQLEYERRLAVWEAQQNKTLLAPIGNTPTPNPNTGLTIEQQRAAFELEQREKLIASKENSLLRKHTLIDEAQRQLALDQQRYLESIRTAKARDVNPDLERQTDPASVQHFYPNTDDSMTKRNDRFAFTDYKANPFGPGNNGYRPTANNSDITPQINKPNGIDKFAAAIPAAKGINTTRDDRVDGFVLFLLLCSLGLNMYLAFISRGFYVRYHELADELRETFSATL